MDDEDDTDARAYLDGIVADIKDPERWRSLSEDRLCQVIGQTIRLYAEFTAEEFIPFVTDMYPYVAERVPAERRYKLLGNITRLFVNDDLVPTDDNRHRVDALLPFITLDPDPRIVSTATLDFSILRGSTTEPWLGVDQAFFMFDRGGVVNRPAILQGLIALGDRRLSTAILDHLVKGDVPVIKEVSKFSTSWVAAATVDLCCDWLASVANGPADRDPGGSVFGHVAAALFRLATRAAEHGVIDVSRVFPPLTPQDGIIPHGRWTRAEYADVIAPRLRELAVNETEPRILPDVLAEWGIASPVPSTRWFGGPPPMRG